MWSYHDTSPYGGHAVAWDISPSPYEHPRFTNQNGRRGLAALYRIVRYQLTKPLLTFLDLPYEVREAVYQKVCEPRWDGSVPGALNVLLLSKRIRDEAYPFFSNIPHKIILGDTTFRSEDSAIWGMPRRVETDWHPSLKRLVLVVSVVNIGLMTPDTFDIYLSNNARAQWRSLKRLIGIWPETREEPLEQIMLVMQASHCADEPWRVYRADAIRLIRNFKRTGVWAETGNCDAQENSSVLLPLARAFNQARRNWVEHADYGEHLFIRYDVQRLKKKDNHEEDQNKRYKKWDVVPINDTSRTDYYEYPERTDKEEQYVRAKLIGREKPDPYDWECSKCLAAFERRKGLREHLDRGNER